MKRYEEMTREEINAIVNRGGADLRQLNAQVSDHLNGLELSRQALAVIHDTDLNSIAECFGGLFTAEEVEEYIAESYPEEE